jgi:hypothetical protein
LKEYGLSDRARANREPELHDGTFRLVSYPPVC